MAALSVRRAAYGAPFDELPVDILPLVLAQLDAPRDWHACALVNRLFCRLATPFLYRTLDSRVISRTFRYHPSFTLIARPMLARYVRHVTETSTIHGVMLDYYPDIIENTLAALALCSNLRSLTWIEEDASAPANLPALLDTVRTLPLCALTIRTHSDIGAEAWAQILALEGIRRIALWCMDGPPRTLHGKTAPLGTTLTHLELGVSAFAYHPSELFAQFPLLQSLRLKGAHADMLPAILACLPDLHTLDTEYLAGAPAVQGHRQPPASSAAPAIKSQKSISPHEALRHLTVRTNSMDTLGLQRLWTWICEGLVPYSGLKTFSLHAFAYSFAYATPPNTPPPSRRSSAGTESDMAFDVDLGPHALLVDDGVGPGVPRRFLLDLGARHGATLTALELGDAPLTLADVRCVCMLFTRLAVLRCAVACADVVRAQYSSRRILDKYRRQGSLIAAIAPASQLTTLSLKVRWLPPVGGGIDADAEERFTLADARRMMAHRSGSKLRVISVGRVQYLGRWEPKKSSSQLHDEDTEASSVMEFVVSVGVVDDRWKT